jgi:prolyl-tRNA editing enzyme YbaK/EbsC (Cys-tRNA(Pro) deacylase)
VRDDGSVSDALTLVPALDRPDLLADPVRDAISVLDLPISAIRVAEIDPELADTAAFCARYEVPLAESANCVLIAGRRGGEVRMAAALVLATTRADVNGVVRRLLDVRKASFASWDAATGETGMEYGGITPIGLPKGWPVYVDARVAAADRVVIGSGLRRSKLVVAGSVLAALPGATVVDGLAV